MFKIIHKLIGYILSVSNWFLLFGGVIIVSYLFFANINQGKSFTIDNVELVNNTLQSAEPLQIRFHAIINKTGCDIYAERTITNAVNDEIVWQTTSPISHQVLAKEISDGDKPVIVAIPTLKGGQYFYYAKVHMICGKTVEIIPTKLLPFTVRAEIVSK